MSSPATSASYAPTEEAFPATTAELATKSPQQKLDGTGLKFVIISTHWHEKEVVNPLVLACKHELLDKGVARADIECLQVPGAYELPFAASQVVHATKKNREQHVDAVICIGCMVKQATMAYEFVTEAVAMGIMKLNVKTDTPVIFGVLPCQSLDRARKCAAATGECGKRTDSGTRCNHGVEWARAALELAHLRHSTLEMIERKSKIAHECKQKDCTCSCHCRQCRCRTCSCKDCKCATCRGHDTATKPKIMRQFVQALNCTGCGESTDGCQCMDCNCAQCSGKQEHAGSGKREGICRDCRHQTQSCVCKSSRKPGKGGSPTIACTPAPMP